MDYQAVFRVHDCLIFAFLFFLCLSYFIVFWFFSFFKLSHTLSKVFMFSSPLSPSPGVSNPDWFAEQLEMRPAKTCRRSGDVRPRGSIIPCGKSDLVDMKLQAFGYKLVGTTTYETNPTNYQTFDSILTMRETKILNFANISRWAPHVELSNIETLCANEQNFDNWVSVLAQKYSLSKNSISTRKANGFCPWDQTQSFYLHADDPAHLAAMGGKETIALINRYLQPSIEALAGYSLVGR
eukprot:m.173430 g.173430  ORF g.173430 m.173430 type:complete len:239 (+) comp25248_c0_seq1:884-1600(+)